MEVTLVHAWWRGGADRTVDFQAVRLLAKGRRGAKGSGRRQPGRYCGLNGWKIVQTAMLHNFDVTVDDTRLDSTALALFNESDVF